MNEWNEPDDVYDIIECRAASELLVQLAQDLDRVLLDAIEEGQEVAPELRGTLKDVYTALDKAISAVEEVLPDDTD